MRNLSEITTLKCNTDFRRAYLRGKSYTNPALVLYVNKNRAGLCRVGITTSKKIGNAVQRNRARRVIREALRQLYPEFKDKKYDIVFVARTKTVYKSSADIQRVMKSLLVSAGITE